MKYKNFFNSKVILILTFLFILLTIINIFYAAIVEKGFTFDGARYFVRLLNYFSDPVEVPPYTDIERARWSVTFVQQLPLEILYKFFKINSKFVLSFVYNMDFFLFPFIVLIVNSILGFRSKRFDIVFLGMFLYCLFVIPVQVWPLVEAMLAIPLFFLLVHYLIADIDYNFFDIVLIFIMCLFSYLSSDAIIYSSVLVFLMSLYYAKKTEKLKNKIIKYFIGINCLLMPVSYILFYKKILTLSAAGQEVVYSVEELFGHNFSQFYREPLLFLIITFISMLIFVFISKKLTYNGIIAYSAIYAFCLYLLILDGYFTGFENEYYYRIFMFIILPVFIIIPFLLDLFAKYLNEDKVNIYIFNMLIVILLSGCINNCVQIYNSYLFHTVADKINEINSEEQMILSPKQYFNKFKDGNKLYNLYVELWRTDHNIISSIALAKSYKINHIIFYEYSDDILKNYDFYVNQYNHLSMNYIEVTPVTVFWDLSSIVNELNNNEELKKKYYRKS